MNSILEIDNARQWILHSKIEYLNDSPHLRDPSYRPPLCEKTMWDIKMKIIVHLPLEDAVFFWSNHTFLTLNTLFKKKKTKYLHLMREEARNRDVRS